MAIFFRRGVERLALVDWQVWSFAAIPVNLTNLLNAIDPTSDTIFNMPDIPTNARILFDPIRRTGMSLFRTYRARRPCRGTIC